MSSASIWMDRETAIVNSIISGNNACGTLQEAIANGDLDEFLRNMVRPTLLVCANEAADLRKQRDDALKDAEAKRFALESVAANVPKLPPAVRAAMESALPGRRL